MALFAAEKMTTGKLRKQLEDATKDGRGGAADMAALGIMKAALEKKMREEMEKERDAVLGAKASEEELANFEELRKYSTVNYNQVSDLDVLADAMHAAVTLEQKRILMRYKRLKAEMIDRDRPFTYRVTTNYFTMVRKCGPLSKYRDSLIGAW